MLITGVSWALLLGVLVIGSWASTGHKRTKRRNDNDIFAVGEEAEYRSPYDLEDMYVSAKLMKGYDALSPGEFERLVAQLMDLIDLNSDGFINRHELYTWLVRSLNNLHGNEITDRFEETDLNGDGMITWEEVYADAYGPKTVEQMESEERALVANHKELFEAADSNKDGKLDFSEFGQLEAPEEFPHMLAIALKQAIRGIDANKDGRIDFQEFSVVQSRVKGPQNLIQQFNIDYDKNQDGYLSGTEIVSWLFPNLEEIAEFQADYLFETVDKHNDGRLPYQAIIDKYGRMLAYDAIDLGLNLRLRSEDEL